VLPEVPSSLALIFRSKISTGFRTYFFRDKYSAPRIPLFWPPWPRPILSPLTPPFEGFELRGPLVCSYSG